MISDRVHGLVQGHSTAHLENLPDKTTLTVREIAKLQRVSDPIVRNWIATKRLPATVLPGTKKQPIYRVQLEDYENFVRSCRNTGCA